MPMQNPNVLISALRDHVGSTVTVRGWATHLRSSGKVAFVVIRDGSGVLQAVLVRSAVPPETWEAFGKLTTETSVSLTGAVRADARSPLGFELAVRDLRVVHEASDYPITPKEHGTAFLMEHRHLWLRSSRQRSALRVRSEVEQAIRDFFYERDFTLIDSPILTPAACEGTSTLFETDYFGDKAYLSQSGQLYLEPAAAALGKVYCFGPTFRAENSNTARHAAEFWMIEPEMAFYDILDNMQLAEEFLQYLVRYALDNCAEDLAFLDNRAKEEEHSKPQDQRSELGLIDRLKFVADNDFQRLSYTEAIDILKNSTPNKKKKFQDLIDQWGVDLQSEHERFLVEKHFKKPVILYNYPAAIKAFYMRQNDDGKTVRAMDILFPGIGEIIDVAMAKDRDERYHKMEDMLEDLELVRQNQPPKHARRNVDLDDLAKIEETGKTVDIVAQPQQVERAGKEHEGENADRHDPEPCAVQDRPAALDQGQDAGRHRPRLGGRHDTGANRNPPERRPDRNPANGRRRAGQRAGRGARHSPVRHAPGPRRR